MSDQASQLIRRIDGDGIVSTVAGVLRSPGYDGDGLPALESRMFGTTGDLADLANRMAWFGGALSFVDTENSLVRRYDPAVGTLDRIAGTYQLNPVPIDSNGDGVGDLDWGLGGYAGDGGPALDALVNRPRDLAFAADGTLYVADTDNHCIRVITPDGIIETFAGRCGESHRAVVGEPSQADDMPATDALLSRPFGVALDPAGNVYISDSDNHVIRVVWAP